MVNGCCQKSLERMGLSKIAGSVKVIFVNDYEVLWKITDSYFRKRS